MEKVFSHGLMAEDTRETTMMIRNREEVFSYGQMEENMMENGSMENNTEKVSITHLNKK